MYEIIFYKDKNGREPVLEYIQGLDSRNDIKERRPDNE